MKPTMPMNAFPPGGSYPGSPPPGGGPPGGGWGPPPGGGGGWGTPPPGGGYPPGPPAAPPQKSRTGLYIGIGCGCLLLLGCVIGGIVAMGGGMAAMMGPGEEVASTPLTPGQPFSLNYVQQGSQKYEAWLEVDVSYSSGYSLTGTILLSENGTAFGQYTLAETGSGSPIVERDSSKRMNWVSTNVNGSGSSSGEVALFPIPAKTASATITLSGTLYASPGTTGTIRLFVAERD